MKRKLCTEYYGLGEQDDTLKTKIEEIVLKFNSENQTNFIYARENDPDLTEDENELYYSYWSVRSDENPDKAKFLMPIVFDDETDVISHNQAETDLVETVLDAMQECSNRQGFTDSLRFEDYEEYNEIKLPSNAEFIRMIKAGLNRI